eukprot:GHUV01009693.1.p1 GENE.GHUV01009693.1~~GHUV01009693.1.p1  ORF type:complete len:248 (+),score=66.88 GHUV01009693.1:169-912(+)
MSPKAAVKSVTAKRKGPQAKRPSGSGRTSRLLALGLVQVLAVAAFAVYRAWVPWTPPEITPLKAPLMKELAEYDQQYKSNMLWGSYRSGLYFGMRTRTSRPLLLGTMWFDPEDPATITQQRIRHEAQQEDKLDSYGWVRHDGRSYGRQQMLDGDYQLTIQMVKSSSSDSSYGGDWSVRIKTDLSEAGRARQQAAKEAAGAAGHKPRRRKVSLLLYFADAHWRTGQVEMWPQGTQAKLEQVGGQCSTM